MDRPTENLSRYVKEKGINLSKMARETGILYMALYNSLGNKKRSRNLRAEELVAICRYLDLDPASIPEEGSDRQDEIDNNPDSTGLCAGYNSDLLHIRTQKTDEV